MSYWNDEEMTPVPAYPIRFKPSPESPWCNHNMGVLCSEKDRCNRCGWNPEVETKRKVQVRKRLKESGWFDE